VQVGRDAALLREPGIPGHARRATEPAQAGLAARLGAWVRYGASSATGHSASISRNYAYSCHGQTNVVHRAK
jgi:hypothetical protein